MQMHIKRIRQREVARKKKPNLEYVPALSVLPEKYKAVASFSLSPYQQ